MRRVLGPVLAMATVVLVASASGWAAETKAKEVATGSTFTSSDVCSVTGCDVKSMVKAKGDKVYVQMTYVKNAKMFRKKNGSQVFMIVDLKQDVVQTLNASKKTYSEKKLNKKTKTALKSLLAGLKKAKDGKSFVGKKKQKGVFHPFGTVRTTVSAAKKNVTIDDKYFSIPKGYKKASSSKKGKSGKKRKS